MSLKHYESISDDFEKNWFFTDNYFPTLSLAISKRLKLVNGDVFGDFGCGTGNYTKEIIKNSSVSLERVLGVDFSAPMVAQFKLKNPTFEGVCSDLESYVGSTTVKFHKVLLKEVIHHVKNYDKFCSNLNSLLKPNAQVLIVTRPQKTNFPFFESALKKFSENQISESEIVSGLEQQQFMVERNKVGIEIKIKKNRLFEMIQNRFMSTFNNFSDSEINLGINEIDSKYPESSEITFVDDLLLITAVNKFQLKPDL